jgi:hypothetical protein
MDQLNSPIVIGVIAAVLVIGALAAVLVSRRRSQASRLQERYGDVYEARAGEVGARKAVSELADRERQFQKAHIRDLSPADQDRYAALWQSIQSRFVDDPSASVAEADRLVADVMRVRGYPAGDDEQLLADVAVGHPNMFEHYRDACAIARRRESEGLGTEDLRQAIVHYRAIFEELLGVPDREPAVAVHSDAVGAGR